MIALSESTRVYLAQGATDLPNPGTVYSIAAGAPGAGLESRPVVFVAASLPAKNGDVRKTVRKTGTYHKSSGELLTTHLDSKYADSVLLRESSISSAAQRRLSATCAACNVNGSTRRNGY